MFIIILINFILFGIKLGNWKLLMLDEIINYVRSLQNQVEVTLLLKNLINIVIMN